MASGGPWSERFGAACVRTGGDCRTRMPTAVRSPAVRGAHVGDAQQRPARSIVRTAHGACAWIAPCSAITAATTIASTTCRSRAARIATGRALRTQRPTWASTSGASRSARAWARAWDRPRRNPTCSTSAGANTAIVLAPGDAGPARRTPSSQALSRYPVRKIQATTPSDTARNSPVTPRLSATLTSPVPWKLHLNPLTR